jgi:hypothetical protein
VRPHVRIKITAKRDKTLEDPKPWLRQKQHNIRELAGAAQVGECKTAGLD